MSPMVHAEEWRGRRGGPSRQISDDAEILNTEGVMKLIYLNDKYASRFRRP